MSEYSARFDQLLAPPIFIVGAARSGTTWLLDVFKAHDLVATYHESWLFTMDRGLLPLLSPTHDPDKHQGLGRFMSRQEVYEQVREVAKSVLGHAIRPGHRYLVEKSPNHIFHMDAIRTIFPSAKFIHVLRDGRDVAVSARAASLSWAPEWKTGFAHSIAENATAWKNLCRVAAKLPQSLEGDYLEIRYEDLHWDPLNTFRKVFDFATVPYTNELLNQIRSATDFQANFTGGEEKFRRGGRVGDWRSYFSIPDAIQFNYRAGDMLIKKGYEKNRWWLPKIRLHPGSKKR